jgi:hypothetical protein
MENDFIGTIRKKTVISAIGVSALRNQGPGVLGKAQKFCEDMDLSIYSKAENEQEFQSYLDKNTEKMLDLFAAAPDPIPNRPWGTARKALNLFLRDALYNKYLSREYELEKIEKFLEIPLDSVVAIGLNEAAKGQLPKWTKLKLLEKNISNKYQKFAKDWAKEKDLPARIHLDALLWLENRKK